VRKPGRVVLSLILIMSLALAAVVYGPRTVRTISLHRAEDRWHNASVEDYTWRLDTGCFGACTNGAPIEIVVRNGEAVHVSGERRSWIERNPMTVEQLFRRVERAVGANGYAVTFDPELGFPTEGRFDPSRGTSDDEWGFTVERLHAD
jgi:hypothetical protein